jgi:hypothetical protein
MINQVFRKNTFLIFFFLLLFAKGFSNDATIERHIEVSMRMIGHQVLLLSGDSTTRVLPISKEKDRYKIEFESNLVINPDDLVATINKVVAESKLSNSYIVEVEDCQTAEVVYSYEMEIKLETGIIPCKGRDLPKSCYNLYFTLIEHNEAQASLKTVSGGTLPNVGDESSSLNKSTLVFLILLIGVFMFFLFNKNPKNQVDENLIQLGAFYFDARNTELRAGQTKFELTGKEADLLMLLYQKANTTVERDIILNKVWGDEGDYVGRTLDVFISKLRKKLETDSTIKIVNIRGVGYKLVIAN